MRKVNSENKVESIRTLIMLSVMFPGAGQVANGDTVKGVITIAISALLFVDIIVHSFIITYPLFWNVVSWKNTDYRRKNFNAFKNITCCNYHSSGYLGLGISRHSHCWEKTIG